MRILVTGGAGFIASHVVDRYIEIGHQVAVLDDLSRGSRRNLSPKAHFYQGDIQDRPFLERVFAEFKPEMLNHHAAQMDVRRGVREPLFDARVNILGSLNLLELAVAHKARRFIYISTAGAAYGEPQHFPVPEDCPINPITPYGVSKHTVEHYLFTFSYLYGIAYVVLRYGNVYGPRQSSQGEAGVVAMFSEQILGGLQTVIYGDGSKTRDYVYIADVVRANVAALEKGAGEMFNIASSVATTDLEVFTQVRDLLGQHQLQPKYVAVRPGEIQNIYLDIRKAQRILEWKPQVTFADGVRQTVAFFRKAAESAAHAASVPSAAL
jgi:UDP-glucose 4-epimerase